MSCTQFTDVRRVLLAQTRVSDVFSGDCESETNQHVIQHMQQTVTISLTNPDLYTERKLNTYNVSRICRFEGSTPSGSDIKYESVINLINVQAMPPACLSGSAFRGRPLYSYNGMSALHTSYTCKRQFSETNEEISLPSTIIIPSSSLPSRAAAVATSSPGLTLQTALQQTIDVDAVCAPRKCEFSTFLPVLHQDASFGIPNEETSNGCRYTNVLAATGPHAAQRIRGAHRYSHSRASSLRTFV